MNGTIPIVRIELQGMQHAICTALDEHLLKMSTDFRAAVESAVRAYDPSSELNRQVRTCIDAAMKLAVEEFFSYGPGREAVRESVDKHLRAGFVKKQKARS